MQLVYDGMFNLPLLRLEIAESNRDLVVSEQTDEGTQIELLFSVSETSNGIEIDVPDSYDSALIDATVYAHDPNKKTKAQEIQIVYERSVDDAASIPGWASWTEDEALAWLDANIVDLLDAVPDVDGLTLEHYRANAQDIDAQWQDVFAAQQQVIRALARLVIALRNKAWPKLEGS